MTSPTSISSCSTTSSADGSSRRREATGRTLGRTRALLSFAGGLVLAACNGANETAVTLGDIADRALVDVVLLGWPEGTVPGPPGPRRLVVSVEVVGPSGVPNELDDGSCWTDASLGVVANGVTLEPLVEAGENCPSRCYCWGAMFGAWVEDHPALAEPLLEIELSDRASAWQVATEGLLLPPSATLLDPDLTAGGSASVEIVPGVPVLGPYFSIRFSPTTGGDRTVLQSSDPGVTFTEAVVSFPVPIEHAGATVNLSFLPGGSADHYDAFVVECDGPAECDGRRGRCSTGLCSGVPYWEPIDPGFDETIEIEGVMVSAP